MKIITLTHASQRLNVSRSSIRRAALKGILTPVHGGLFGRRLIGVTNESIDKLLSLRQMNNAFSGKEVQE